MKTSIASVSISGSLTEKLAAIAEAGYTGIEIFEQDFLAHDGGPAEVGRMIRNMGLEITLFQPFRDFECLPEPERSKAFDRAKRKFDLMRELGTDLVLFCSSCHPRSLGGIDRAADDFAELGEIAKAMEVRVGYEALAWGRHVNDHRDAWEIVRRANHENIGLILDSFHTLGRGIDPESIRSIPGDKIFFVQLADAPKIDMDLLYWSRHFRNMPGEGDLDVGRFMQAVAATGYDGPVSLEIFNDQFRGGNPRTIARDGYRSLIAVMDDVRRAEPALELAPSLAPVPMPARVAAQGFAFVEFAAQDQARQDLSALLGTLGFDRVARHRNKALDLWQAGEARIVVNAEVSGHAGKSWVANGTSVCDIGIQVASAEDAVARAAAMGARPFEQPLAPGEILLPAIRGLGGSVTHFIGEAEGHERVWDIEFEPVEHPAQDQGIKRIDHLAQTMSYDEMLSWTLFYTTLFDMRKSPMVDVIDPDGVVRSQVIETGDGSVRLTLNGAETLRTLAGAFLSNGFGKSVQHIALETDDIFGLMERLDARGFEALPMPANYYDDLAARFDFQPGLLERMRKQNILYDRDERGEFFQVFSKHTAGGVFFEYVQRVTGYQGFGGPNAPFRIAAQKRLGRPKGMPER